MSADNQPVPQLAAMTRDEARAKIFAAKPEGQKATLFGVEIELREPPISDVLDTQMQEDRKRAAMIMLIRYCYLPNGEPLFEEGDIETLLSLPFGKDYRDVNMAIQRMIGVIPSLDDKSSTEE